MTLYFLTTQHSGQYIIKILRWKMIKIQGIDLFEKFINLGLHLITSISINRFIIEMRRYGF